MIKIPHFLCLCLYVGFHLLSFGQSSYPNIVLVFIDDLGYGDLSCYGNQDVSTPNIDLLAAEGIRFTQFYVNSPICSPSRVAITTGQYPARHGINSFLDSRRRNMLRNMADYLDPRVHTLARTLRNAGYATAHFGKWHMGGGRDVDDAPAPMEYGYTESFVDRFEGKGPGLHHQDMPKSHSSDIYMDKTLDFIRRHQSGPFYVNFWPNDMHDPFVPKTVLQDNYRGATQNPYLMDFYAVLDNLDYQVGRLMAALKEWGLEQNTLIIFTSDNGPTDWPRYYREGFSPPGSSGSSQRQKMEPV